MAGSPNALERILNDEPVRPRQRPGYAIVHIDCRTFEIVNKPTFSPFRRVKTYELKLDETVEIYDNVRPVMIFKTAEEATIKFRLSVIARAARAEKIVQALADPADKPSLQLLKLVEEAIRDEAESSNVLDPGGLAASIMSNQVSWQINIQRRLEKRTGFETTFIFELPPAPGRVIVLRRIEMRTRDAPNRATGITLHVTLEVNGKPATNPLPVPEFERTERVRDMLGTWFPEQVTLYQLWFEKYKAEKALAEVLSAALGTAGYRVKTILMDPVLPAAPREEQVQCAVPWTGHSGREVIFSIDTIIKIRGDGAATFDALKPLPRQTWLGEATSRSLKSAMNGIDFQDLNLPTQHRVTEDLKKRLRAEADATGQEIEDPLLPKIILAESKWLENAIIHIPAKKYKTKNTLVDAEFSIRLEVQFDSLRPLIEGVITYAGGRRQNADYNSLIEEWLGGVAVEAATAIMLDTPETDYYSDFEPWVFPDTGHGAALSESAGAKVPLQDKNQFDIGHGTGLSAPAKAKVPVRDQIQGAIIAAMKRSLTPSRLDVILSRVDSRVAELMRSQQALGRMIVAAKIEPLDMRTSEQVLPVKIVVNPSHLDPREVAAALRRDRQHLSHENVEDSLRLATEDFLQAYTQKEIFALRLGRREKIFRDLEAHLNDRMLRVYGFPVQLETTKIGYSEELTIELRKRAYLTKEDGFLQDHKIEELEFQKKLHTMTRKELLEQAEQLSKKLKENPRQSEDDIVRYRQDEYEYRKLVEQIREEQAQIKTAANAQFALGKSGSADSGASNQSPAPDDDYHGV